MRSSHSVSPLLSVAVDPRQEMLDRVFFALSDATRRDILRRLGVGSLLVSEIAQDYAISLQAVSRHIQVLVRAGLVVQNRTGRISQCSLEVGPLYAAAVWINGYSKYWQAQFDALKTWLTGGGKGEAPRSASRVSKTPRRRK